MPFRNIETHFSQAPQANVKRSSFKFNKPLKTTFNAGDLVPFLIEEVLPGDTFDLKLSKVIRLTTSIHPTMDNLYLDTYFFFVPNRFLWDHWVNFMGESDKAWTDSTEYVPPYFLIGGDEDEDTTDAGHIDPQSILQYLGIPAFNNNSKKIIKVNALPFNAYVKVWNDWFRSENLCNSVPIYTGDGHVNSAYIGSYCTFIEGLNGPLSDEVLFGDKNNCLRVAKFADYFTRALPQPQKGADVLIPAGGKVELDLDNFEINGSGEYPKFVDKDGNAYASNPSMVMSITRISRN